MAWTVTTTYDAFPVMLNGSSEMVVISIACVSDASGHSMQLSDHLMQLIRGGYLYEMVVKPDSGDAPSATWDIDLEDYDAQHILDTDDNATDAITSHAGSATLGYYPVIERTLRFVSASLGNTKKAVVDIKVLRG